MGNLDPPRREGKKGIRCSHPQTTLATVEILGRHTPMNTIPGGTQIYNSDIQCYSKNFTPCDFLKIFPKRLRIFNQNFIRLLRGQSTADYKVLFSYLQF